MTPIVAMGLVCLQNLTVKSCASMKHVVAKEEGDTNTVSITFPLLSSLHLENLDNLTTFYSSDKLDSVTQPLFSEKVSFPMLQKLYLSKISNLTEIWTHDVSYGCCNLTTLRIYECENLKYVLTRSVTLALEGLQRLTVRNCARMKHIVAKDTNTMTITFPQLSYLQLEGLNDLTTFYSELLCEEMENSGTATQPLFNEKVSFPKLDYLNLDKISHLNVIWNHKLQVPPCPDLTSLTIYHCKGLKHIFPYSMVPSLNKLEDLTVGDCEVLETIIGDDKSVEEATTFLFPKLSKVYLERLPKAECFYPKEHTIQYPELKELNVGECGKLSAFDVITFPEKQGDAEFEKVMSNFKNMSITSSDLMKIMGLYDHNLPPHLFPSLGYLQISEFHDESIVFPSKFLSIIHNQLQSFEVFNCFFQEIFPFEREDIHDDILFPQLHTLRLKKLSELKYIYKQDQWSPFILNVLERLDNLHVEECHRLTNLVPSLVFFRSLTRLFVKDCGGLTNLIQPSTARSLVHLSELVITGCNMMETVIGDGGEESSQDGEEFFFTSLRELELEKLPKLTNFCSSPYHAFNFPELEDVRVIECPNMKTFCGGITTTPELLTVDYEGKWHWEGDLNTTIQQRFAKIKAKRLSTVLPSTSLNNHVEANVLFSDNSSEKLIYRTTEIQSCPNEYENSTDSSGGTGTCGEVVEEGKEGAVCVKASAPHIPDKGKGKEVEVFEQFTDHSDPCSKLSNHYQASTSSNNQFDQHAEKAAENCEEIVERGRKQVDICAQHVVPSSSRSSSLISSSNNNSEVEAQLHYKSAVKVSDEPIIGGQICENSTEMSANIDVERSTCAVSTTSSCSDQKLCETQNHSVHFIPLLSEYLQIIQNQPVKSMSKEQVQFMENAYRDLSDMNFSINWFIPYVDKARQYLTVLEQKREVSELESEITKMEAQMEAMKQKKRALQEKYDGIASHLDLDKSLYKS